VGVASTLGQPVRRREDARLLAGQGQFLDDVPMPNALHMAFVRSPHAHARVHTKGPGAFIFTAKDLAGRVSPGQIVPPPGLDVSPIPHPLLADGEVRYVGQPVAAVVAESRARAEDLAEQVEVEYEPLPAVLDPRAGDPIVRWEQRAGDVAGGFARAAHVVRTERVIGRLTNSLLEGSGALAVPDGERLTVWTSSLSAHRPRAQLAQMLRRDEASLRVIVPDVGGGFGSKGTLPVETPVVAFDSGGLPDIVQHDRTGILVPTVDAAALAAAITSLLDRPDRGAALGAAGRLHALATFAPESVAKRYADIYKSAIASSPQ